MGDRISKRVEELVGKVPDQELRERYLDALGYIIALGVSYGGIVRTVAEILEQNPEYFETAERRKVVVDFLRDQYNDYAELKATIKRRFGFTDADLADTPGLEGYLQ